MLRLVGGGEVCFSAASRAVVRTSTLLLGTLVLLFGAVPPASAGEYEIWSCADPSRLVYDNFNHWWLPAGWRAFGDHHYSQLNTCQTGPPSTERALKLAPLPNGVPGTVPGASEMRYIFTPPHGADIQRIRIWSDAKVTTPGMRAGFRWGIEEDWCAAPCMRGFGDPGTAPANPFADARLTDRSPVAGQRGFEMFIGCAQASPCTPGGGTSTDFVYAYAVVITMKDFRPPSFDAAPTGSLLAANGRLSGAQTFSTTATDDGGGVAAVALRVDGVDISRWAVEDAAKPCKAPFQDPQPCPAKVAGTYGFDTSRLVDGKHVIQVAVTDVAGNTSVSDPVIVTTSNRTVPCASPVTGGARIDAGLGRRGKDTVLVPYGRTSTLKGRILDPAGRPLPGVPIQVIQRRIGSDGGRIVATLTSDEKGRVRFRVRRGASRDLWLARPEPGGGLACSTRVRLNVKAGVVLTVRPRSVPADGRIRFRGRLLGGPRRRGVAVAIYAVGRRLRDRVPVTILRTRAGGKFRFQYRFRRSFAPFTYRFRVRVHRQRGYPYAAGWSDTAVVRVVPG